MKPILLTFCGINSYQDEFSIDFENLAQGGIFGIFGDTGSGKSTILDAMTLALFGTGAVSRYKGTVGTPFINTGMDAAYTSLAFEVGGQKYTVERGFKRKTKGIDTTKCRLTAADGTILADRLSSEVTAAVTRLLGLNYEDFTRSILLPQGKFSEFLFLKGEERGKMLERLFNLEEFGKRLQNRIRDFATKVGGEIQHCEGKIEALGEISAEDPAKIKAAHESLLAEIGALGKQKEDSFALWEHHKVLNANYTQLKHFLEEQARLQAAAPLADKHREAVEAANRAEKIRQPVERLSKLEEARRHAASNLAACDKLLAQIRTNFERAIKEYAQARKALEDEAPILQAILRLERERALLRKEYKELQEGLRAAGDKWAAMALEMAQNLRAGRPCPICGSREHPNPATGGVDSKVIQELEISERRGAMSLIEEQGRRKSAEIEDLREILRGAPGELEALENSVKIITIRAREAEDLKNKYDAEYQEAAKNQALARERAERLAEDLAEQNGLIGDFLAQGKFDNLNSAQQALMPPEQKATLEAKIGAFEQKCAEVSGAILRLEETLAGNDLEEIPKQLEAARKAYETADLSLIQKREQAAILQKQAETAEQNLAALQTFNKELASLKARHGLILEIQGLFKGNAFIKFIARRHLHYITTEATTRLKTMTAGQYAIEYDDDTNFLIRDDKNAGKYRPASSLSGGEAFMASLCLALALANKIQMHNAGGLSFFFLDEGFGALDKTALDTVLTALESLAAENMTVGLISHVEDLKHRILNKIEL
ncbi:MAG: SMC family ATPase [Clostridiales bacterium]|jgi:exonuclease SbcC|nr:SMC family ATPase [Clostridiales bacterium]